MKIARYYQKTLFGMFALMGLIVISTSALYVYTVDRQLTDDLLTNNTAIARSIANSNVALIVNQNYSALQSIIDQFIEIKGVSYVFVVDETGTIIAHTFVPGVPKEIASNYKDGRPTYDRALKGMGNFTEVTANILAGEAGRIHVGMDKGYMALQVQTAIVHAYVDVDRIMPPDSLIYPEGQTAETAYTPLRYSFTSLEGFLNAKLMLEILRRMGPSPNRADLQETIINMSDIDVGMGDRLSFGGPDNRRQASDKVYYTVVKDGHFDTFDATAWKAWTKP